MCSGGEVQDPFGVLDEMNHLEEELADRSVSINHRLFRLKGATGGTDPHDTNVLALVHACTRPVVALAGRGQCAKDVSYNARQMNFYMASLGTAPSFKKGLDTPEDYLTAINEMLNFFGFEIRRTP